MKKVFAFGLTALLWATSTLAQPPTTIAYQGTLASAGGTPLNATVNIEFKVYDTLTGGTALWSETKSVQVTNGKFAVELGTTSPLIDQLFGQPLYLGIKVAADGEMTPRLNLTSTPYAFRARSLLRNTIHVAQDGTPEQAGTALQAAVAAAGIAAVAGAPMSIELDAGTFILASALSLPSFVHLHGQGRDATIVKTIESGAGIVLNSDTSLTGLTVVNEGSGGVFANPSAAVRIENLAQRVALQHATLVARPANNQVSDSTEARAGLFLVRSSELKVSDVDIRSTGAQTVYGIREVSNGDTPAETDRDVSFENVTVVVSAGSIQIRGIDLGGQVVGAQLRNIHVEVSDGGVPAAASIPQAVLGLRLQAGYSSVVSDVDVDIEYNQPTAGIIAVSFVSNASLNASNLRVRLADTVGCDVSGYRVGYVLNTDSTYTNLPQLPYVLSNLQADVDVLNCSAAAMYVEGSAPQVHGASFKVAISSPSMARHAAGIIVTDIGGSCGLGEVQNGTATLDQIDVRATGNGPSAYGFAMEVCRGPLLVEHSSLAASTNAIRLLNNSAGSYDARFNYVSIDASATPAVLALSDATANFRHVSNTAGSTFGAFADPESGNRATMRCLATTDATTFYPGPACPCTLGTDCPVTP